MDYFILIKWRSQLVILGVMVKFIFIILTEMAVSFFLSFFLPILCSVISDHDNRVGVWHISLKKKKKKKKKYCDTATSRLKLFT